MTTLQYLLYNYLNEVQRLANQIKNTTNAAGIQFHLSEGNPDDHHGSGLSADLHGLPLHAEIFCKGYYGRRCKGLIPASENV